MKNVRALLLVVVGAILFAMTPVSGMAAAAEKKEAPKEATAAVAPAGKAAAQGQAAVAPEALGAVGSVNINTASAGQLTALPGIGPKLADAIIAYRQENGDFKSVDELTKVKGIGDKLLARLRPHLQQL